MISNLMKRFGAAIAIGCLMTPAVFGDFVTINIDGNFSDWAGVTVLDSDGGDNAGSVDIGDVQIANDDDFLYLSVTYPNVLSVNTYISIDVDSDTATGFDVFSLGLAGVEASWQNDFPFTNGAGSFNNGFGMTGDFFGSGAALISPAAGVDAAQKEWAISLNSTFNETGAPVFADDDFTVLIWTDAGAGDVSSAIPYTLMPNPAAIPEPSSLILISLPAIGLIARRRRS